MPLLKSASKDKINILLQPSQDTILQETDMGPVGVGVVTLFPPSKNKLPYAMNTLLYNWVTQLLKKYMWKLIEPAISLHIP